METVQNAVCNKTIYSGEVECDLAHTDALSWPVARNAVINSDSKWSGSGTKRPHRIQDFHPDKVIFNEGLINVHFLLVVNMCVCVC